MLRKVARLKVNGLGDGAEIPFYEGYSGTLHRDDGAGAHRDADIGSGESRCVVDPVSSHGDNLTRVMETADFGDLVSRGHSGFEMIEPQIFCYSRGGALVVSREHYGLSHRVCAGWQGV